MAGVELATASEPPRGSLGWGRRPSGVDPSHPLRCYRILNFGTQSAKARSRCRGVTRSAFRHLDVQGSQSVLNSAFSM